MNTDEEFISFDPMAHHYDNTRAISDHFLNVFLEEFKNLLPEPSKIKNILEIGCGTGRISKIFATNNYFLTGVDVSENMLSIAEKKAKSENWNFKPVLADARKLPFSDNQFDMAYTVHVLHLIKDWKQVISEALRCSKFGIFANFSLHKSIFNTPLMKEYWKKINELHKDQNLSYDYNSDKKLGAQNDDEIKQYMETIGYSCHYKEFSYKSTMKNSKLIEIAQTKSFSNQRFLSDDDHTSVMNYLENNNYFLPTDSDEFEIFEEGKIFLFYNSD